MIWCVTVAGSLPSWSDKVTGSESSTMGTLDWLTKRLKRRVSCCHECVPKRPYSLWPCQTRGNEVTPFPPSSYSKDILQKPASSVSLEQWAVLISVTCDQLQVWGYKLWTIELSWQCGKGPGSRGILHLSLCLALRLLSRRMERDISDSRSEVSSLTVNSSLSSLLRPVRKVPKRAASFHLHLFA